MTIIHRPSEALNQNTAHYQSYREQMLMVQSHLGLHKPYIYNDMKDMMEASAANKSFWDVTPTNNYCPHHARLVTWLRNVDAPDRAKQAWVDAFAVFYGVANTVTTRAELDHGREVITDPQHWPKYLETALDVLFKRYNPQLPELSFQEPHPNDFPLRSAG